MKKFTLILACTWFITFSLAAQFANVTKLEPLPITTSTTEEPQSKVWSHAGKYWAVLTDSEGTFIWRLDGSTWTKNLKIAVGEYAKADCKVSNDLVHTLLFRDDNATYLVSAEYNPVAQSYFLWKKRTEKVAIPIDAGTNVATIDIDGKGRMWVAYIAAGQTKVKWSDSPYSNWSPPTTLGAGGKKDEQCSIIAIPALKKIAVLWSNQTTQRFGLRTHSDGADPATWSDLETAASQSAVNIGTGMADDHLDMVASKDGTLYCAVKTSYDTQGHPKLALLVRRPTGSWDNLYSVSQSGTRPIVVLNEASEKLKVIYTSNEGGGALQYREAATSSLEFSQPYTLLEGMHNYATTSKANYSSEVLLLATNVASPTNLQAVTLLATDAPAQRGLTIQALPNPFLTKTKISFVLQKGGDYTVSLYDCKGVIMGAPHVGTAQAGEVNTVEMDGTLLSAGLYLVRLKTKTEGASTVRLLHEW
jgi:hypothetical protein